MLQIDLNADVGEGVGDDAGLFHIITSANVASGGHAGGGTLLQLTVDRAVANGVEVGAHPSYPDRAGFGRTSMADSLDHEVLRTSLIEQIAAVSAACAVRGVEVVHVKPHGALYNDAMRRSDIAEVVVAAARAASVSRIVGLPGSVLEHVCAGSGVTFIPEAYADRAYEDDGTLVSRTQPGAVIDDEAVVVERVLGMVLDGTVRTRAGHVIPVHAATVCVHGDTPGAVDLARAIRAALEGRGVSVRPSRSS